MKRIAFVPVAVMALAGAVAYMAPASGEADGEAAPIFGVKMPPGYRDWRLISVAHEEGNLNDLRAILGNDAIEDRIVRKHPHQVIEFAPGDKQEHAPGLAHPLERLECLLRYATIPGQGSVVIGGKGEVAHDSTHSGQAITKV